jgi:hypothetical protein
VSGYVTSNAGPLSTWSLITPPAGFTISGAGVITAAAGTAVTTHSLTVRVSNDVGSADATFTWNILEELLVPQWTTIPNQSDRIDTLPQTLSAALYATSNAGDLINWRLASAPSGFSINSSSGLITAAASAGVGGHSLRVGVTNSIGESLSNTFTWTVLEELLPPQWSTIPNRSDDDNTLPQTYDVSGYVTSNSGALDTWSLPGAPAGFVINQSGVITAATDATKAANSITVQVFNDEGSAQKSFTWTIVQTTSDEVYHEFNATLGVWDHERVGSAWGFDKNDAQRTVGTDIAIYEGCGYSGAAFVPVAGFLGIRIDAKSTNEWLYSNLLTDSSWLLYQAQRTATQFLPRASDQTSLYKGASMSSTVADRTFSVWTREEVTLAGPSSNIIALTPDFTNIVEIDFGPALQQSWGKMLGFALPNAGITGNSTSGTLYAQFFQSERYFGGATGPILTSGSQVTRNAPDLSSENSDYGWGAGDMADGLAAQVKFRANMPNDDASDLAPGDYMILYGCVRISGGENDVSNYCIAYLVGSQVVMAVYRNAVLVAQAFSAAVIQYDGDYDLRIRYDPAVGIRMWLTGPGVNVDVSDNGAFAQWTSIPSTHKLGMFYEPGDGSDVGVGSNTFKTVRLSRVVPTDAEIIAWS